MSLKPVVKRGIPVMLLWVRRVKDLGQSVRPQNSKGNWNESQLNAQMQVVSADEIHCEPSSGGGSFTSTARQESQSSCTVGTIASIKREQERQHDSACVSLSIPLICRNWLTQSHTACTLSSPLSAKCSNCHKKVDEDQVSLADHVLN